MLVTMARKHWSGTTSSARTEFEIKLDGEVELTACELAATLQVSDPSHCNSPTTSSRLCHKLNSEDAVAQVERFHGLVDGAAARLAFARGQACRDVIAARRLIGRRTERAAEDGAAAHGHLRAGGAGVRRRRGRFIGVK